MIPLLYSFTPSRIVDTFSLMYLLYGLLSTCGVLGRTLMLAQNLCILSSRLSLLSLAKLYQDCGSIATSYRLGMGTKMRRRL